MTTTENRIKTITDTLSTRININKSITLPVLGVIRDQATKFNGKAWNRRFTKAVTVALADVCKYENIRVDFMTKWDGTTEYDIITVHYRYQGEYGEFTLYPDRNTVKDYTDESGRLDASKLIATCDRYETATRQNIADDENAIALAPEFVARVEAIRKERDALNKDFPLALNARIHGNVEFYNR